MTFEVMENRKMNRSRRRKVSGGLDRERNSRNPKGRSKNGARFRCVLSHFVPLNFLHPHRVSL
ncbi:hypothetical protein COLO4_22184 [Corchorus olitorius]|uniref:Uncharacterized protein n=1 Tax=Corchorus olitorius TaxID=93759 RepID=A0A1R3INM8_9ROSI|nr:hypothetical protein COLO4_22184 [Corchorus olitorius]